MTHDALAKAKGEPIDSLDKEPQSSPVYTGLALQNNWDMNWFWGRICPISRENGTIKKETRLLIALSFNWACKKLLFSFWQILRLLAAPCSFFVSLTSLIAHPRVLSLSA